MGRPEPHRWCDAQNATTMRLDTSVQSVYVRKGTSWQPIGWMCLACHHFWPRSFAALTDDPPEAWMAWLDQQLVDEQQRADFLYEIDRLQERHEITAVHAADLRSLTGLA